MSRNTSMCRRMFPLALAASAILLSGGGIASDTTDAGFDRHITLDAKGLVNISRQGEIQIKLDAELYRLQSVFSYPGKRIRRNKLADASSGSEPRWKPKIRRTGPNTASVHARGSFYSLDRRIELQGHRITVTDQIRNISAEDVGIILKHRLIPQHPPTEILLCGVPRQGANRADNPTVFCRQKNSGLGLIAEDNISRAQFQATAKDNQATFGLPHLGLPPKKTVKLKWSIYPLSKKPDYFSFINRVRRDWGVNHRIDGPGDWFLCTREPYLSLINEPEKLRDYLDRKKLKIIMVNPWLEWDHLNHQTGKLVSRDQFKKIHQKFYKIIKRIDREIQVIACIEAPFVTLPQDLTNTLALKLDQPKHGTFHEFTPAMFELFERHPIAGSRWGDSLVWSRNGQPQVLYISRKSTRGQHQMMGLLTRAILGNGQHDFLMDQVQFVVEQVGLDGFYLDSLMGSKHQKWGYSFDRWDGVTVDIDTATGQITNRYTDLALASVGSRKSVLGYGTSRGLTMVVNGHPIDRDTQALPVTYLNKSAFVFKAMDQSITPLQLDQWLADKPPLRPRPCESHLSSPIVLGFNPRRAGAAGAANYAKIINKGVIAFLRHGLLYFHYNSQIPETGSGSGEYGPINHMFPITPLRLGEGFVEGAERIVTCISESFTWKNKSEPTILLFDLTGQLMQHDMHPVREDDGWRINFEVDNWQQIAIAY